MPSFTAGQIEDCLTKLRAEEGQGGRDRKFVIKDDENNVIAYTKLSRGWTKSYGLSPNMISAIKRQLRFQNYSSEFIDLVQCPLTRSEYIRLATSNPPPSSRH
ncbi:putative YcfA-like protein [Nitrolancea hollandica Lb]|uniref:Putative YcfA-like protein n=1 Tax=Nitrolancea hollandica Lb TaxID=1129897 RepID=I4EF61_9BACT|nr:putative YcfA-like protein [Nitrolancea hollandica Lb]